MIIPPFLSATLLRLRNKIATESIQLKLMRLAPQNTYPPMKFRQMELGIDFWKSQLRIHEYIARKFDPDQPRVPAGNPDGGQWTDGGVGRGLGATAGPKLGPVAPAIKPAPSLKTWPSIGSRPIGRGGSDPRTTSKRSAEFLVQGQCGRSR